MFRVGASSLNEVEALTDRGERIAAYREILAGTPSHSLAWFNLAVDELDDGDPVAARRAALRALTIDDALRGRLPPRLKELVDIGGVKLTTELAVSPTMMLYAGRTDDGGDALVRALRDRPADAAAAAYDAHARLGGSHPDLIRALRTSAPSGGLRFQILEYAHGQPVGPLLRGAGPHQGFGIAKVSRVDLRVAGALVVEILDVVHRNRAALVLDPDPELWLRTRGGVLSLGPPGLTPSLEWLAPEERDGPTDPAQGQAYRAALLVWCALTGGPPPTLHLSGVRTIDAEALPEPVRALAPTLQAALDRDPAVRPSLAVLLERVRTLLSGPITIDGQTPPELPGYRIARRLGEGGFGVVYEAVRVSDGTRVAIKVLHRHLASSGEARMRFVNEAEIASKVQHPGVVRVLDHGSAGGVDFMVMELVDGMSLEQHLARAGKLSPSEVVDIGRQTAAAVGAVHRTAGGVVHRDLKPGNLLLAGELLAETGPSAPTITAGRWTVKVTDFGIAKLLGEPTEAGLPFTQTGQWNGTPPYMAPEQWRQEAVDARTDVYALGCVLYECLTGRPPFVGKRPYELLDAHLNAAPPPLPSTVPPRLATAVMRMLAKRPADRFADMAAVEAALVNEAPLPPPPDRDHDPPPPPPWWKRHRGALIGGTAVAVAAVVVALLAIPPDPDRPRAGGGTGTASGGTSGGTAGGGTGSGPGTGGGTSTGREVPACLDRLWIEWPPAVCPGNAEGVWDWDPAAGACVQRRFTMAQLTDELRRLAARPTSPFAGLPADLTLEVHGTTGMGVRVRDGAGNVLGKLYIGYAGVGDQRDGGLRLATEVGGRTVRSEPVYLSRRGLWCDARNRVIGRAAPP